MPSWASAGERLCRHRGAPVLAVLVLLSLALNHAYLFSGFQADDLIFLRMRATVPLPYSRWTGFWAAPIDSYDGFKALWWLSPDARGGFFRPLPSLFIEASLELFGETAFPLHLAGVVLHGAVAYTVFALFRRLTAGGFLALLTASVFLACEDHSMGVGWIATVTDILCVLFANAALLAHLEHRESGRRGALVRSLVLLVCAFGCKESAALAPVAILLLELVLPDRLPVAAGEPSPLELGAAVRRWLGRYRRWVPAAAVMALYLVAYRLGGFGLNTLMYLDPFGDPAAYFANLAISLPVMILATVTAVPPSLVMFLPGTGLPLALAGLGIALLLGWALRPLWREPVVVYALGMFFVALLPQMAALASERLLYFPMVFGSYVLARLCAEAWPVARRLWPNRRSRGPRATRAGGWAIGLGTLLPGLLLSAGYPYMYAASLDQPKKETLTAAEVVRARAPAEIVVLNTSGMFLTIYVADVVQYFVGRSLPVAVLSSGHARFSLARQSDRSFVLRADRAGWLGNAFANLVRTEPGLTRGQQFRQPTFVATLLDLTPDGRDVLAVRFDFREPVARPGRLLLTWNGQRFVELDYGALADGETRLLADTSHLWGLVMPE